MIYYKAFVLVKLSGKNEVIEKEREAERERERDWEREREREREIGEGNSGRKHKLYIQTRFIVRHFYLSNYQKKNEVIEKER